MADAHTNTAAANVSVWLEFRERAFLFNFIKVRFRTWVRDGLAGGRRSLHDFDQVRCTTKELFVIVRVPVRSLGNHPAKAPSVGLSDEGRKLTMFEVRWDDLDLKLTWFEDLPGPSMWHPRDDIGQVGPAQNGIHFGGEVRNPSRSGDRYSRIRIGQRGIICVIEERSLWLSISLPIHISSIGGGGAGGSGGGGSLLTRHGLLQWILDDFHFLLLRSGCHRRRLLSFDERR